MNNQHSCENIFLSHDPNILRNAKKVSWVLLITLIAMIFEIYYGYVSGSMALLADGWHMASHAAALGITYITYQLATRPQIIKNFNFGGGKIIALGGFTSSVILLFVVLTMFVTAIERLFKPEDIQFNEALFVATLGFIVNIICAYILKNSHSHSHSKEDVNHEHHSRYGHSHEHDHNMKGAYLHVLADAFTSVGAICSLLAAKYYGLNFLDPLIALLSSVVILKWAIDLLKDTSWELLDGYAKSVDYNTLKSRIESSGAKIVDLHVWKISPKVLLCELVVISQHAKGIDYFRRLLEKEFAISHSVIEERQV